MNTILVSILLVTAIGLLSGLILSVFSIIMETPNDERVEKIIEVLPGANCGACGYSGCSGYANAIVKDGEKTNLCIPGGLKVSENISSILGKEVLSSENRIAVIKCCGDCNNVTRKMNYEGIDSCLAAIQLNGGAKSCSYGCLGLGDCKKVCPYGAIIICDGVAVIDREKCKGCALCVAQCPKGLIKMHVNKKNKAMVYCSNEDKGVDTRKVCKVGCIGCMRCVKECKFDAIKIENNLAIIDTKKCVGCGKCAKVCKPGCINIIFGKK